MARTAVQVMREISLVKAQTKDDPSMREVLLKPLQAELKAIAEFTARQGELQLEKQANAVGAKK